MGLGWRRCFLFAEVRLFVGFLFVCLVAISFNFVSFVLLLFVFFLFCWFLSIFFLICRFLKFLLLFCGRIDGVTKKKRTECIFVARKSHTSTTSTRRKTS